MSNFDIGTLLDFNPPKFLCAKCRALLYQIPCDWKMKKALCPVCKVPYLPTEQYPLYKISEYLRENGDSISFDNPVEHGQKLAAIAYNFHQDNKYYPPMRALFEALNSARQFVHFTTFGLSHILYGALKLKAQSISIRGIAANIHHDFVSEIRDYPQECGKLDVRIFERNDPNSDWTRVPHQKLIVIDGLMAFKGAANMTNEGWRKAATGRDHVEIVTNIRQVAKLHNKLFSPVWAESSNLESITMAVEDNIPF